MGPLLTGGISGSILSLQRVLECFGRREVGGDMLSATSVVRGRSPSLLLRIPTFSVDPSNVT